MKKLLSSNTVGGLLTLVLIGLFVGLYQVNPAIVPTTEWDVRTTGDDTNGGGFDPAATGQDFSQQDAAQISYTDLVIGGTTTQATSAAHPFTACSAGTGPCGNIVNEISGSGCTVQRAQVVSVSGSTATFDKSLGTAASTCTAKLGGSLATIATVNGAMGTNAYQTVHIKAGTYTFTSNLTLVTLNTQWIGYQTTHNDGGTKPLITTATNSTVLFTHPGSSYVHQFRNISFSNTASTRANGFNHTGSAGGFLYFTDCILDGFAIGVNGHNSGGSVFSDIVGSGLEIKNSTSDAILNFWGAHLFDSYLHDNAGMGLDIETTAQIQEVGIIRTRICHNTGNGIFFGGSAVDSNAQGFLLVLSHDTIANNGGDNVKIDGTMTNNPTGLQIENTVIYGAGGWGVNLNNFAPNQQFNLLQRNNAYGGNTSGDRNHLVAGYNDKALTVDPFVSSATGDYTPNTTAGGGAVLRGAASAMQGSRDIGAVQSACSGGGSAACSFSFLRLPR